MTLLNASNGVFPFASGTLSGAAGALNFNNTTVLRLTLTGDTSGTFSTPTNIPTLEDGQRMFLAVELVQDATGGRTIDLATLFGFADTTTGLPALVDLAPNAVNIVELAVSRVGGVNIYTANFVPGIVAEQIVAGTVSRDFLPVATGTDAGIVTLANGSGAAARGNHTHEVILASPIDVQMSGGGILTNGDYDLVETASAGRIVRLTKMRWQGGTSPTGTVSLKIDNTVVTGTGTAVISTASGDSDATAANTFVARQTLRATLSGITGNPTRLTGYAHYAYNTQPWAG